MRRITTLIETYDDPEWRDDEAAADGGITCGMVWMKEARDELERIAACACPTCEGMGWVTNPDARYSMEYVEHLPTGIYSTNDPEEIDCPQCMGVGFVRPRAATPATIIAADTEEPF